MRDLHKTTGLQRQPERAAQRRELTVDLGGGGARILSRGNEGTKSTRRDAACWPRVMNVGPNRRRRNA
jgi:hypothetical protein